ncbi:MAG TPA: WHG domain-containing protein [Actinocrinis sp.]|uniref:TetR/AcrR family transcriptional regulator n=1 Tax=Actinocrinis sp. TaxID=1920516 RepID=UPI002D75B22D|nr:WHG domain-containing protein [Actinocrinis sp.]HZU56934.1 WHG domain-containing protein [Actinocrinis sp.]
MPRAGLSPDAVVDAALEILDARGSDGLTLKAIADATGVAAPSLYKHVRGLPELRRLLAIRILNETAEQMGAVVMGRAGEDALKAYLTEYRRLASEFPHRHALIERAYYDDPAFTAASERLVNVAYAVVRGFGLTGEDLVHAVRCVRAAVTGFVSLELGLGYRAPTETDASFAYLSRVLATGLRPSSAAAAA